MKAMFARLVKKIVKEFDLQTRPVTANLINFLGKRFVAFGMAYSNERKLIGITWESKKGRDKIKNFGYHKKSRDIIKFIRRKFWKS